MLLCRRNLFSWEELRRFESSYANLVNREDWLSWEITLNGEFSVKLFHSCIERERDFREASKCCEHPLGQYGTTKCAVLWLACFGLVDSNIRAVFDRNIRAVVQSGYQVLWWCHVENLDHLLLLCYKAWLSEEI